MVITDKAAIEPVKEMSLDVFIANKPAIKNVLSPISETNTKENAWEGRRGREGGREGGSFSCSSFLRNVYISLHILLVLLHTCKKPEAASWATTLL